MKLHSLNGEFITEVWSHPANFTGIIKHENGCKRWRHNNKLHRLDGPAVEYPDGTKYWFINGIQIKNTTQDSFKLLVDIMKLKGLL